MIQLPCFQKIRDDTISSPVFHEVSRRWTRRNRDVCGRPEMGLESGNGGVCGWRFGGENTSHDTIATLPVTRVERLCRLEGAEIGTMTGTGSGEPHLSPDGEVICGRGCESHGTVLPAVCA